MLLPLTTGKKRGFTLHTVIRTMNNIFRYLTETPVRKIIVLLVLLAVLSLGILRLSNTSNYLLSSSSLRQEYTRNLQTTYLKYAPESLRYRIGIIADRDTRLKASPEKGRSQPNLGERNDDRQLVSPLLPLDFIRLIGRITSDFTPSSTRLGVQWNSVSWSPIMISCWPSTIDTGVVSAIDIEKKMAYPVSILMEGDGRTTKGQKNEWATIKDGKLFVGSIGKEWTNSKGEVVNYNNQWIKELDSQLVTKHVDWRGVFEGLREATHTKNPGYLIHEAVCWSSSRRRWYFLPRRVSELAYDDAADEERGSNTMISLDEHLAHPQVSKVGPLDPRHGFSSCKFVPFRENEILALKTMEFQGAISSFIAVYDISGSVLMPETYIGDVKFEGVEFL